MNRIIPVLACAIAFASQAPAADAKFIAPFLDDMTLAVAHADLSAIDADSLFGHIGRLGNVPAKQLEAPRKVAGEMLGKLQKLGVRNLYVVVSVADIPAPGPLVVLDGAAGANAEEVKELMTGLNFEMAAVVGNALVAGSKRQIERVKTMKPALRPDLAAAFDAGADSAIQIALVPGSEQRRIVEEQVRELPKEIGGGPGTVLTHGIRWGVVSLRTKPVVKATLIVKSDDAAAAKALAETARKALEFAARAGKEMHLDLAALVPVLSPKVEGDRLTMTIQEDDAAVVKLLTGAAAKMRGAAGRAQSTNNLKQLALALHNYHDANSAFPATGSLDQAGKPLLSWRVHILPYIEQEPLYKQFKLDEPWDSEHNKSLIAKMPDLYKSPGQNVGGGKTTYLAPMGKDTIIAPGPKGVRIQEITDGTSNTIMVVETGDDAAVTWTKPDDFDVSMAEPLKKLLGHWGGGFIAAFGDGSVRFIGKSVDPKLLAALFTRSGGEVVGRIP